MCWCCRTSRSTALFIKMKCIIHKILPFIVYCRSTPELAQSSPLNRGVGSFPFSSMEAETMVSPLAWVQCPFLPQCPWPREDVPCIARLPHVRAFTHASFPISKSRGRGGESRQKDSHSISHAGKLICFRNWFLSSRVADTWTSLQTEAFPSTITNTQRVLFPAHHLSTDLRNYHTREQKHFGSLRPFPPDILCWLPLKQWWSLLCRVNTSAEGALSVQKQASPGWSQRHAWGWSSGIQDLGLIPRSA